MENNELIDVRGLSASKLADLMLKNVFIIEDLNEIGRRQKTKEEREYEKALVPNC